MYAVLEYRKKITFDGSAMEKKRTISKAAHRKELLQRGTLEFSNSEQCCL